jgi:hypothetical protein
VGCFASLNENYGYPSVGLFLDANGDGRCGAGDLFADEQLYGWNEHVDFDMASREAVWTPVEQWSGGVGRVEGAGFCAHFGF